MKRKVIFALMAVLAVIAITIISLSDRPVNINFADIVSVITLAGVICLAVKLDDIK